MFDHLLIETLTILSFLNSFSPQAGWTLHFWLDPKTKQKNQGSRENGIHLFAMPKFGRVIFEPSSHLPGLTKASLQSVSHFFGGLSLGRTFLALK